MNSKKKANMNRRRFLATSGALAAGSLMGTSAAFGHSPVLEPTDLPLIKPPHLKPGDTVAMIAPAGAVFNKKHISKFEGILKNLGFHVIKGKTLITRYGYMSGKDQFRADELNALFADKNVQGMIAMRGGWGSARMLDLLDYDVIKANPKVLMGFSDITSLLIAITQKTGLVTFHGPVGYSGWNDFSTRYFKDTVMNAGNTVTCHNPSKNPGAYSINEGKATGILYGGNLTVLSGIIGSQYTPDWEGKILFLEETHEEVYRIDRMLTHLKLAGVLDKISGLFIGKCNKCEPEFPHESLSMEQMLREHLEPLGIPVYFGGMFGHVANKFTLPVGIKAELDGATGDLRLLEAAVV